MPVFTGGAGGPKHKTRGGKTVDTVHPPATIRKEHRKGATLNDQEVGQLLLATGWPKDPNLVAKGIAIVEAESGGDWSSTSPNPSGGTNRGGWQIDSASHPDVTDNCAFDPFCSSKWVWRLTKGKNFSIWATASADPHPYLDAARKAIQAGPLGPDRGAQPGDVAAPVISVATGLASIAKFFAGLGELLLTPDGWIRLGKLLGGAIIVIWGLSKLAGRLGGGKAVRAAKGGATKGAEAAALAKQGAKKAAVAAAL